MTTTRQQREQEQRARDERIRILREEQRRLQEIEREQEARLRYLSTYLIAYQLGDDWLLIAHQKLAEFFREINPFYF